MVCKGKVTGDNMSSTLGSLKLTFLMFCLEGFTPTHVLRRMPCLRRLQVFPDAPVVGAVAGKPKGDKDWRTTW